MSRKSIEEPSLPSSPRSPLQSPPLYSPSAPSTNSSNPNGKASSDPWKADSPMRRELTEILVDIIINRRRDEAARSSRNRKKLEGMWRGMGDVIEGFWVVAVGLRAAFLVETVQFEEEDCALLGQRFENSTHCAHLAALFEVASQCAFGLNTTICRKRLSVNPNDDGDPGEYYVAAHHSRFWVDVTEGEEIEPSFEYPDYILQAFLGWGSNNDNSTTFVRMEMELPEYLPAVAASLLEYPVRYHFSGNGSGGAGTNLDGRELVLVQAWMLLDGARKYCLTSFSYPAELHETEDEHALAIVNNLETRTTTLYNTRLRDVLEAGTLIDPEGRLSIEIVLERKVVDRVIL